MALQFKVSALVSAQRLGEVSTLLATNNIRFTTTPVIEQIVRGAAPAPHKLALTTPRVIRPRQKRVKGGAKPSQTARGRIIVSVFRGRVDEVKRSSDLLKALEANHYTGSGALISDLVAEGVLVKVGRGAYRLPTTAESLRQQQAQDPSFSG